MKDENKIVMTGIIAIAIIAAVTIVHCFDSRNDVNYRTAQFLEMFR